MLWTMFKTLKTAFSVRGYKSTPESAFPIRMGSKESDMFRIAITDDELASGVSLSDFHAAFLSSPVFQTELWLLSKFNIIDDTATITREHLNQVATGEMSTFGLWTAWAVEGSRNGQVTSRSDPTSRCQIMRCYIKGKPFVDTWWSVEKQKDTRYPELVFGTSPLQEKSLATNLLAPCHRLCSRLLIASAKVTLIDRLGPLDSTAKKDC
jgi:hypothetical protein